MLELVLILVLILRYGTVGADAGAGPAAGTGPAPFASDYGTYCATDGALVMVLMVLMMR